MRHRTRFHSNDTTKKPSVEIWADQTAVPVKDDSEWTLGVNMVASTGLLVLTAAADAAVASRNIPGVMEGVTSKVTIVLDSIDAGEIDVVLGGVAIGSLDAAGTFVFGVVPTAGNLLSFTVDNPASVITGTISSVEIEAQGPIRLERIPVI